MDKKEFESVLERLCNRLTVEVRNSTAHHKPSLFEQRVREVMSEELAGTGNEAAPNIDQGFPDIVVGGFGAEVKATESDNWRCIANSVSEGQRARDVQHIYLVYGKMGGTSEVRWAAYGDSIVHVRTSHVPRFEVEIGSDRSLFETIGISYEEFRMKPMDEKMPFIRSYARGRLKAGERLWWLENREPDEQSHSLSLGAKVYMDLPQPEKRRLRAEAALMSPKVVGSPKTKHKYVDVVMYLMSYRGVLCPQARDLFSAGSVAGTERGGNYVMRSLMDIQDEMRSAAFYLEDALFEEYWGLTPPAEDRLLEWLRRADDIATNWKPSDCLFLTEQLR